MNIWIYLTTCLHIYLSIYIYIYHQPEEGQRTVFFKCLDLYHTSPDSGERQCKSRAWKRRISPALRAAGHGCPRHRCQQFCRGPDHSTHNASLSF